MQVADRTASRAGSGTLDCLDIGWAKPCGPESLMGKQFDVVVAGYLGADLTPGFLARDGSSLKRKRKNSPSPQSMTGCLFSSRGKRI